MIRSFLFKFFFYSGLIFLCVIFIPGLVLPKKIVSFAGKLTGFWSIVCLKIFLSTNIEVKGLNNLVKDQKFYVACTHQSAFETFYLQTILNSPFFIIKKELTKIPLFGSYLMKIGCIWIDRNKISKNNADFQNKIDNSIKISNNPLIIFPQGKRFKTFERPNFKKGISRIHKLKIQCQPIVMNSGDIWPKEGRLFSNKSLIISILKPLNINLNEDEFLTELQNKMYSELDIIS